MLDKIAMWIGYIIIIAFGQALIGIFMWITYITYDYYLKKLLGWKHMQIRKDLFYFIKHKKEIQNYIKSLSNSSETSSPRPASQESLMANKRKPKASQINPSD